jgi:hypothetical protein
MPAITLAAFQVAGGSYATVVLREAAPVIRVDLADAHFSAGDSVRLEVTADGSAPLTYSWFREGVANPLANAHGPALELANLGGAGSGRYYVVVRNRAGEVSSRRAELVFDEPPAITGPLALDSARTNGAGPLVLVGDSPTLRLTVQGSAPLGFFWQRDGALVSQTVVPNLTLASVTAAHAGSYRVVVSNTFGAVTSAPVVVTVHRAPAIVKMTAPLELLVRSPLQLAVEAAGDAPLTYQWFRNGEPVAETPGR